MKKYKKKIEFKEETTVGQLLEKEIKYGAVS